ncbi:unnamed protein product, partial [Amoebophrya sp. A120]|eukprot:GSA120T00013814001.1
MRGPKLTKLFEPPPRAAEPAKKKVTSTGASSSAKNKAKALLWKNATKDQVAAMDVDDDEVPASFKVLRGENPPYRNEFTVKLPNNQEQHVEVIGNKEIPKDLDAQIKQQVQQVFQVQAAAEAKLKLQEGQQNKKQETDLFFPSVLPLHAPSPKRP